MRCGSCGGDNRFEAEQVADRLTDVAFGAKTVLTRGTTTNFKHVSAPTCRCGADINLDAIPIDLDGEFFCGHCGAATPAFAPPPWLQHQLPALRQIIGAERDAADLPASGLPVTAPSGAKPVVLACPQCRANLKVNGDTERTLVCQFCSADVFLPDDLWRILHPVARAKAWTIVWEGALELRSAIEERERERQKEAQTAKLEARKSAESEARENARLAARAERMKAEGSRLIWVRVIMFVSLTAFGLGVYYFASRDKSASTPPESAAPRQPRTAGVESAADRALRLKLKAYTNCMLSFSTAIERGRRHYIAGIKDLTRGPTCRERKVQWWLPAATITKSMATPCSAASDAAWAGPPPLPALERGGAQLVAALRQLVPLSRKAARYYARDGDYKRDRCAFGRKLHPKLMAAWAGYLQGSRAVRGEVARLSQELYARLAVQAHRVEGDGPRTFFYQVVEKSWQLERLVQASGELEAELRRPRRPPAKRFDLAQIEQVVSVLAGTVPRLLRSVEQARQAGRGLALMDRFTSTAARLVKAGQAFTQRCRARKHLGSWTRRNMAQGGIPESGSAAWVIFQQNYLINEVPSVGFR